MPVTSKELEPAGKAKAAEMMDGDLSRLVVAMGMTAAQRHVLETALANAFYEGALWHKRALEATNEDA